MVGKFSQCWSPTCSAQTLCGGTCRKTDGAGRGGTVGRWESLPFLLPPTTRCLLPPAADRHCHRPPPAARRSVPPAASARHCRRPPPPSASGTWSHQPMQMAVADFADAADTADAAAPLTHARLCGTRQRQASRRLRRAQLSIVRRRCHLGALCKLA